MDIYALTKVYEELKTKIAQQEGNVKSAKWSSYGLRQKTVMLKSAIHYQEMKVVIIFIGM